MKKLVVATIIIFQTVYLSPLVLGAQYKYDNLHRLTRVIYNNGRQITYTYDDAGNRTDQFSTLMADSTIDGSVDFQDFAILASRWLAEDCIRPDWCESADIDWSTAVDMEDLAVLAQQWLASTE
jgi:YD repeat-containing protein